MRTVSIEVSIANWNSDVASGGRERYSIGNAR